MFKTVNNQYSNIVIFGLSMTEGHQFSIGVNSLGSKLEVWGW